MIRQDEFVIECPNVGELNKIQIGHDNKGLAAGWFLDTVWVEDLTTKRTYEFPCNKWLAKNEDDGQITRFLFPKNAAGGRDREPAAAGKVVLTRFK